MLINNVGLLRSTGRSLLKAARSAQQVRPHGNPTKPLIKTFEKADEWLSSKDVRSAFTKQKFSNAFAKTANSFAKADEWLSQKAAQMAAPKKPKPIAHHEANVMSSKEQAHYDFYRRNPQLGPAPVYQRASKDDYYTIGPAPRRAPEPMRRFYDFG